MASIGDRAQAVVAKRAGISVGALNKYLHGSEPGAFKAARLAEVLGVDLVWLLTGRGQPNAAAGGYLEVDIIDLRLAAGNGMITDAVEVIGKMPLDRDMLRSLGRTTTDGLKVATGDGDSMIPTIADGGRVLIDTRDTRLREGVFAFRTGEDLRLKRLRPLSAGIEIISDNDRYPPEVLKGDEADELVILGAVIWTGSPI